MSISAGAKHEAGGGSGHTAQSDLDSNYATLGDPPWNVSVSVATIERGTQQLVLLETRDTGPDLFKTDWTKTLPADGKGIIGYWHNYKTTCGYADGHVELKKLGQTVTPVCEWDTTTKGIYDGKTDAGTAGLYNSMPSYYK